MKNVLALVCIVALGLTTTLRGAPEAEPELKKLNALKTEPLSVVQLGSEVKIVRNSELASLKKEIETKYKVAVKEYTTARASARKAKHEFTKPKPVKETLTVLAAAVKTEEEAEKIREKALNDYLVVKLQDTLKVVRKLEFTSFKAKAEADYQAALVKYNEAKKAAKKNKQAFKEPAPVKPKIKVLASGLTSEDAANDRMQALGKKGNPKSRESRAKPKSKEKSKEKEDKKDDEEIEEVEDDKSENPE